MILFILGIVIGSIGGMIMMSIFLTGKSRESSFKERQNMHLSASPSDAIITSVERRYPEKR